jgi:hypothetical protein
VSLGEEKIYPLGQCFASNETPKSEMYFCTNTFANATIYKLTWDNDLHCSGKAPVRLNHLNVTDKECSKQNCTAIKSVRYLGGHNNSNCSAPKSFDRKYFVVDECVILSNSSETYHEYAYTKQTLTYNVYTNPFCVGAAHSSDTYRSGCYEVFDASTNITQYVLYRIETSSQQGTNGTNGTNSTNTTQAAGKKKKHRKNRWKIAAIVLAVVLGAIILLLLLLLLCLLCCRKSRHTSEYKSTTSTRNNVAMVPVVQPQTVVRTQEEEVLLGRPVNSTVIRQVPVSQWTQEDVNVWLTNTMKMPQYVQTFSANNINGFALLNLQDQDLKEQLVITSLADRRNLLLGINKLRTQT